MAEHLQQALQLTKTNAQLSVLPTFYKDTRQNLSSRMATKGDQ
jgi:hypothetical protein